MHKTFFGKLFGFIGDALFSIFHSAYEKLWKELTPEEQANVVHGSGVVAVINEHLQDAPGVIVTSAQEKFPDLNLQAVEQWLLSACATLGITPPTIDIHGAITAIQKWLVDKGTGKFWEQASQSLVEIIVLIATPSQTIFQKLSVLIEWAYQTFVKPKL